MRTADKYVCYALFFIMVILAFYCANDRVLKPHEIKTRYSRIENVIAVLVSTDNVHLKTVILK